MRALVKRHRIEAVFALFVFVVHGYFYSGQAGNQNARLDGIYAVVEDGHFQIDSFIHPPDGESNTGDWSRANGHYYPNKAPGTVLVGVPFYWLLHALEAQMGFDPTAFDLAHWNAYLINLWLSVFFGSLAAGLFLSWLRQEFPNRPDTTLSIAAVCFFGTLVFPFDSQIWGTTTAAYFIVSAWVFAHLNRLGAARHFVAGASLGMSVLFDYAAAIPVTFICIYYGLNPSLRTYLPRVVAGALPVAVVLFGYHKLIFGSFLTHAAVTTNQVFVSKESAGGFFGSVDPVILWKLLFSEYRGMFYFMPVLAFVMPGAIFLYRKRRRLETLICLASMVASLLFISSFIGWSGGSATGPRYLILSLPFYFILLSGLVYANRSWRMSFYVVGGFSGFQMFAIAVIGTAMSATVRNPLRRVYRRLFDGRFGMVDSPVRGFNDLTREQWSMTKFNLGEMSGLSDFASLVPVVLLILGFSLWLRRLTDRRPD